MNEQYRIQVENSAPSQTHPARSVSVASPTLVKKGVVSIVDLGCGRLRNLRVLQDHFSDITMVDTELQCSRISTRLPDGNGRLLRTEEFEEETRLYDAIFMISVLHVIEDISIRRHLLTLAAAKLHTDGYLVIDVPSGVHYYRIRCTPQNQHNDGFVMGKGYVRTFYKNYHAKELDDFIVSSCAELALCRKIGHDKHLIRIFQKKG